MKLLSYVWLFETPMDYCSPPGSSLHGILQARILKWVAISFSRASSWHRDRTRVSHITGRRFTVLTPGKLYLYVQTEGKTGTVIGYETQ